MPSRRNPIITSQFDPGRIVWGRDSGLFGERSLIGIDPRHTSCVVRKHYHDTLASIPPRGGEEGMLADIEMAEQHFSLLEKAGVDAVERYCYIAEPNKDIPDGWISYQYAERLHGEVADPQNPHHEPHLLHLGNALLSLLENIPVGATFYGEIFPIHQYTIGTPYFRRKLPKVLKLHDTDAVSLQSLRNAPDQPRDRRYQGYSFSDCVEMTNEWLSAMPATAARDDLLARCKAL